VREREEEKERERGVSIPTIV